MIPLKYRGAFRVLIAIAVATFSQVASAQEFPESGSGQYFRRTAAAKAAGEAALAEAQTLLDLTRLVGVAPDRCQDLTTNTRICSWEITNKMPGYQTLARILKTSNRVYLVCELPVDNSERTEGSCTVSTPE